MKLIELFTIVAFLGGIIGIFLGGALWPVMFRDYTRAEHYCEFLNASHEPLHVLDDDDGYKLAKHATLMLHMNSNRFHCKYTIVWSTEEKCFHHILRNN